MPIHIYIYIRIEKGYNLKLEVNSSNIKIKCKLYQNLGVKTSTLINLPKFKSEPRKLCELIVFLCCY